MSNIAGDIKKLFNFKYKTRKDSVTDQFNRLLMMKAMIVAAFLTGLSWYNDQVKCVIPGFAGGSIKGFSPRACWINGFYIYEDLKDIQNFLGYYGMPTDMSHNGSRGAGASFQTCTSQPGMENNCTPMKKLFYLQYQWFPFYLAAMAIAYYVPYLLFCTINNDIAALKNMISKSAPDIDDIIKGYFNRRVNIPRRQNLKIILNFAVKIFYLLINILSFTFTDFLLLGNFKTYGTDWFKWSHLHNSERYNYVGFRQYVKPGERLLPTFGFCDVMEAGLDIKHTLYNEHKMVCEISQHVLYHYVLIALWLLLVIGMVISCIGVLLLFLSYVIPFYSFVKSEVPVKEVYKHCSLREREYLTYIHDKNLNCYGKLIRKLTENQREESEPLLIGDDMAGAPSDDITMKEMNKPEKEEEQIYYK